MTYGRSERAVVCEEVKQMQQLQLQVPGCANKDLLTVKLPTVAHVRQHLKLCRAMSSSSLLDHYGS